MTFNGGMKEGVAKGGHIPGPVILSKLSSLLGLFIHLQSVLKHTVTEGSGQGPQILKGMQMSWGLFGSRLCLS